MPTPPAQPRHLLDVPWREREAIIDALYRFGAGQDLSDRALFESAFSLAATLDFTGPARRLGASIPAFHGRQAIADAVFSAIARLDTTHTVTNPRITAYDGRRADLFALVEAQHVSRADRARHLLLKHLYTVRLSRGGDGDGWTIDHLLIDIVWWDGDPAVLFPGPTAGD